MLDQSWSGVGRNDTEETPGQRRRSWCSASAGARGSSTGQPMTVCQAGWPGQVWKLHRSLMDAWERLLLL